MLKLSGIKKSEKVKNFLKERENSEKFTKMHILSKEELKEMGISLPVDYSLMEDEDTVYLLYKDRKIRTLALSHVTQKTLMRVITKYKRFSK